MPVEPIVAIAALVLLATAATATLLRRRATRRLEDGGPQLPDPPTSGESPRVRRLAGPDEAHAARVKALGAELEGLRRELRGAEERDLPRRADQLRELIRQRERQLARLDHD